MPEALGDHGRTQRVIQARHGYGYRLVATVEVHHTHQVKTTRDPLPLQGDGRQGDPRMRVSPYTLPGLKHVGRFFDYVDRCGR